MSQKNFVELRNVTKRFGSNMVIDNINLTIPQGQMVTLLGPSGCGKTTILRLVAGLEKPSEGQIYIDGEDVTHRSIQQRDICMVFQSYALFPHMSLGDNVGYGLKMLGVPRGDVKARVKEALAMVDLEGFEDRYVDQISGGQQQRVALARALVIEPKILLLDEPLANLDAKLREEMRIFIRDLQRRVGITTVYVTHDQAEAMTMSDRVVVMFSGRIAQIGTPSDIYERPANLEVAEFVGQVNIVHGKVGKAAGRTVVSTVFGEVEVADDYADDTELVLALRPEAVELLPISSKGAGVPAKVLSSYYSGSLVDYRLQLADGAVVNVQTFPRIRFADGEEVLLRAPSDRFWPLGSAA